MAELRETRRELTSMLRERSEANTKFEKAETSLRSLRSLCERENEAGRAVYQHRIEQHLRQKKKNGSKVGKLGRRIQRLRSEEKVRMQAVEQAEGAARKFGVQLEKWRQVTGLERWKDRVMVAEESEG
ncbi:hypothetical protein MMC07_000767 [Pseudocyphellaria aurata]|nr:hypothetical protein [Pseudocyphellaria aurata]